MTPLSLLYKHLRMILWLLLLTFNQAMVAQSTIPQLEADIGNYEAEITRLERQITMNNTSGNSSANATLKQKVEGYENEIVQLLAKIKQLKAGASNNSNELELMTLQKELQATQGIVEDLEKEIGNLQKEIQRLTMKGGGSVAIEKLQKKLKRLEGENKVLKQQIVGYRKGAKIGGVNANVAKLEGQILALKTKNKSLQKQMNNAGSRNSLKNNHFLKQFRAINTTNLVLGYRYTIIPTINFKETPSLLQGSNKVGTILSVSDMPASGHYGFMGVEFLFHQNHAGGNLGLTANYAYNEGVDIKMHTAYFQVSGELTILPIRLGIKAGANFGYTFGQLFNHNALLNDNSTQAAPEFSTLLFGFDTKLRFYLSRYIAFAGYFGADYTLSSQFKLDSWDTMFRYGIGIDFIIPLKKT